MTMGLKNWLSSGLGTQEWASWVVINDKKCVIWRNEHQVERVIDGWHRWMTNTFTWMTTGVWTYCTVFYVCVLCFSVLFSRKLSCFLRCSRVPYSWIAPSGSLIPGDPSSVTSDSRIPGIETKPILPEMFRLWMTNSDSDVAHDSLFGES